MPDLLAKVPQRVEHRLDRFQRPGIVLGGQQEQQVDVGAWRQRAAAVSADRRDHEAPLDRRLGRMQMGRDIGEQRRDQLVLDRREVGRAAQPVALLVEVAAHRLARRAQGVAKQRDDIEMRDAVDPGADVQGLQRDEQPWTIEIIGHVERVARCAAVTVRGDPLEDDAHRDSLTGLPRWRRGAR